MEPEPQERDRRLPEGYRPGVISAITVILGFSLLFMRYWTFEAEGHWSLSAVIANVLLVVSIGLQIISLWRALQVEDNDIGHYKTTLKWFLGGLLTLVASVGLAAMSFAMPF